MLSFLDNSLLQNIGILTSLTEQLETDIISTLKTSTTTEQWLQQITAYTDTNQFQTPKFSAQVNQFIESIGKTYDMSLTEPTIESNTLKYVIQNHTMDLVTNVGEDVKQQLRNILDNGTDQRKMPNQIVKEMSQKVKGVGLNRADMIARTETMRAANTAQWYENRQNGMGYFTVSSDIRCCPICDVLYSGREFSIDEYQWLPPLHPRCRCVALFHRNQNYANDRLIQNGLDVKSEVKDTRMALKDAGFKDKMTPKQQANIKYQVKMDKFGVV
jgi:SPP1 gp7 family putative phage head morphogenesis protein